MSSMILNQSLIVPKKELTEPSKNKLTKTNNERTVLMDFFANFKEKSVGLFDHGWTTVKEKSAGLFATVDGPKVNHDSGHEVDQGALAPEWVSTWMASGPESETKEDDGSCKFTSHLSPSQN